MNIQLYMIQPVTKVLGPFARFALWVQGCDKRCPGCISPDAQPVDGGYSVQVNELVHEILDAQNIEGITINGGEPFLQQSALCELIDMVRNTKDIGVIVYTGMLYPEIANTPLAQRCDLIIDGEYIEELNDDRSLRGSSNQNVICITDRYREAVDMYYGQLGRNIEFVQRADGFDMIGIPSKSLVNALFRGAANNEMSCM